MLIQPDFLDSWQRPAESYTEVLDKFKSNELNCDRIIQGGGEELMKNAAEHAVKRSWLH
jgi:hypothetical protein